MSVQGCGYSTVDTHPMTYPLHSPEYHPLIYPHLIPRYPAWKGPGTRDTHLSLRHPPCEQIHACENITILKNLTFTNIWLGWKHQREKLACGLHYCKFIICSRFGVFSTSASANSASASPFAWILYLECFYICFSCAVSLINTIIT